MQKNTKKIFISVFVIIGIIMIGLYIYSSINKKPSTDNNTNIYDKFNPFGSSSKIPTTGSSRIVGNDDVFSNTDDVIFENTSRFHQITDFAVSGATFFEDLRQIQLDEINTSDTTNSTKKIKPKFENVPSLRYVEKGTGHIYQLYLDTKISGKISNSTIPNVYETIFDSSANSIIYRYFSPQTKTINSFMASLGGNTSTFLKTNINQLALSPKKDQFFSLIKSSKGVVGIINSFDETKTKQVFSSSFSEWLPQWVTGKSIYLTTKPSYSVPGGVYSLNIKDGSLSKIFGGVNGLTTLANNSGTIILFGSSLATGPKLNLFDIKNYKSIDINKYGLPEKCVWSTDNINIYCAIPNKIIGIKYPDYWYQGLISFEDRFIKINAETGEISTLGNSGNETPIDATHLFLDKDEDNLFFINKKDYTLWSLDI